MMKIFYIDPQSYNNLGDYDKYLLENIESEKIFFCSQNMPYDKIDKTKIIRLYNYHAKKNIFKIISYLLSQKKLLRCIKKKKPDVVHFQWFKIPLADIILLKKIRKLVPAVKIVFTAHNVLPHDSGTTYKNSYKKIYSLVDGIIVHAEVTKQEICSEFGIDEDKIAVIPHGFLPSKVKWKKNFADDVITFSFIGFLSEYKGLDILLDVWCGCSEIVDNKKCRLVIAGAGDLPCLKTIPKGKNIVVENYFHSEEELGNIIARTDVAILPYRKISQSGVLLSYLAEHIPVIVSNVGGLAQPFELGNVGWVLERLDVDCLRKILQEIISNPEEIHTIKSDAKLWNQIDAFYDWKSIGSKTLDLYKL